MGGIGSRGANKKLMKGNRRRESTNQDSMVPSDTRHLLGAVPFPRGHVEKKFQEKGVGSHCANALPPKVVSLFVSGLLYFMSSWKEQSD